MSTRSRKSTTTTVTASTSGTSTPAAHAPSPGRSPRPPSPTMISRLQEKTALAGLNDRLAAYIDRVRYLEGENTRLSTQIQSHEETVTREVTNIKALYEKELQDARKLIDDTSKERAQLQVQVTKYKEENDELKEKYKRQTKDLENVEKKLFAAEAQINDLQARLNDAVNQRRHWENEYNKLKSELPKVEKQLETAKKQLEDETIQRVDLQNRVQSLKEELAFKDEIHGQELNETRSRTQIQIEEVDGTLKQEYENKLAEALRQMREENDYQIRVTREEAEIVFEQKLEEMRKYAARNDGAAAAARDELRNAQKRIDELSTLVTRYEKENLVLESRIKDLEDRLKRETEQHERDNKVKDDEIARLRQALDEQLMEYRDLLDVKIALDMEIAAYRKLLEAEETRLNISSASEATPRRGTPRATPIRATPGASRKRKRVALSSEASSGYGSFAVQQISQSSASSEYVSNAKAKGDIEIEETDTSGKFIKIVNKSDKDQSLSGWQLKHAAGSEETVYKFHRSVNIKGGQSVSVYSSDTPGVDHSPPDVLVMKGQKWFTANEMASTLCNKEGEEQASLSLKKEQLKVTSHFAGKAGTSRDEVDFEGEGEDKEKCFLM